MQDKQVYALDRVLSLLEEASYAHLAQQDQSFNRMIEQLYVTVRTDQKRILAA